MRACAACARGERGIGKTGARPGAGNYAADSTKQVEADGTTTVSFQRFMIIAGEASGDMLAAELVRALKQTAQARAMPFPPQFFGAGGPKMATAGVEVAFDLTRHAVIGLSDSLKKFRRLKRIFDELVQLACEQRPDVIVCVDFQEFNRRFVHAIRERSSNRRGWFHNWHPKIVQFVSPQVWASRPGRADQLAEDVDLLLSIIPFEKKW